MHRDIELEKMITAANWAAVDLISGRTFRWFIEKAFEQNQWNTAYLEFDERGNPLVCVEIGSQNEIEPDGSRNPKYSFNLDAGHLGSFHMAEFGDGGIEYLEREISNIQKFSDYLQKEKGRLEDVLRDRKMTSAHNGRG